MFNNTIEYLKDLKHAFTTYIQMIIIAIACIVILVSTYADIFIFKSGKYHKPK